MLQILDFELYPFRTNPLISSLQGNLSIARGLVNINFELTGKLDGLQWPELASTSAREYGLWEHTCLEFFIGSVSSTSYHEVNLSPSGNWNCFSFTDVREGMMVSEKLTLRSLETKKTRTNANLSATLDLKQLRKDSLRIGISAVIEIDSKLHYYALTHGEPHGESPDFHGRAHHTIIYPELVED
jgi:hypothetical protein